MCDVDTIHRFKKRTDGNICTAKVLGQSKERRFPCIVQVQGNLLLKSQAFFDDDDLHWLIAHFLQMDSQCVADALGA